MIQTPRKLAANRANARKSTGPRTAVGKTRSGKNAVKHGLLSRHILVPGEDAAVLKRFRADLMARLEPWGDLERLLADRVVVAVWRLRRAGRHEGQILQHELDYAAIRRERNPDLYEDRPEPGVGQLVPDLFQHDELVKLSRYEARIERGLYRALYELHRVQSVRRGVTTAAAGE